MKELILKAKNAFHKAEITAEQKNRFLEEYKKLIIKYSSKILEENDLDVQLAVANGQNSAFIDRLKLTENRLFNMVEGLENLTKLDDPVDKVEKEYTLNNGLLVKKVRAPLGLIGIIFEARPNVAVDCISLCIKSGNAVILRGSKDSANSVRILAILAKEALKLTGINENLVFNLEGSSRDLTKEMLNMEGVIDVVIPRGGEGLKKFVLENATMPVIASSGGNCHIYISQYADLFKAIEVIVNAKTQRPSTCNSLETILINKGILSFASTIIEVLLFEKVKVRTTPKIMSTLASRVEKKCEYVDAGEEVKEYSDMIIKIYEVDSITDAINHINTFGTHHSDSIMSENKEEQNLFAKLVDSSAVYINASTRFTDGFELGLGAEMGISTQKLHVRGPIGLEELTSLKYVVYGNGQTRK